jgi:methylthioribose-1-phosphate isomerase
MIKNVETLAWRDTDNCLVLIDQTLLPHQFELVECYNYRTAGEAIRLMQVRGAPAIGVTAAYALALAALEATTSDGPTLLEALESAAQFLRQTRPTAVNLAWALERSLKLARHLVAAKYSIDTIKTALLTEAKTIHQEDVAANQALGTFGASLIKDGANILTHCNAGALATAGYGTALGVIRAAHEQGKHLHVWVDETRPYLQGARLTAWELQQMGVSLTLITDNMAGHFMQRGQVDFVVVGADRIAANGDTANKIGTYSLAVLAKENAVPFYIAAPFSTVDMAIKSGAEIPIEERSADEVLFLGGTLLAPSGVKAAHPAFDVTPARYIHGIITEHGVMRPPFEQALQRLVALSL